MKKFFASLSIFVLVIACSFVLVSCSLNPDTAIETFTTQGDLKVGIISDSQLPPKSKDADGKFKNNLINSLNGLKANGVNMIIFAGDIGDEASDFAYEQYLDSYKTVFGADKSNWPIVQTIMGNHDYWGANDGMLTKSSYRKRFEKMLGHSPFTHYVVNGYHFIGASPEQGSPMDNQYKTMSKWLDTQISKAVSDDPTKPVFVTTHKIAKTLFTEVRTGEIKLCMTFLQSILKL